MYDLSLSDDYPRFVSIDGESLMDKELPRKSFVINSLLPKGLTLLCG